MDFVDKALARRLESAEEVPQVHHARILQKTRSEVGAAAEAVGGGHMVFAGLGSPVGRAVGMGLDRPMTAEDLDRIEAFYRAHHAPAQVDVCPLHDPALFEVMKQRGYAIAELNNVLWRRLLRNENFPAGPAEIEFRRARDDEGDAIADILALSFHEKVPVPEGFREMLAPMFQFPGGVRFVAHAEGKMVGVGAGLIIPEHKVFALFGAGTLPEFRGRGIQTTLLGLRMRTAAEAGCELAVIVTQGGTISQRNAERLGFRVAYSKATLVRNL